VLVVEVQPRKAGTAVTARTGAADDWLPLVLAGLAIGVFVLICVWRLDVLPPVYEDEPWQASTAYKLAREGVFGSDVFAGWNGMEQHYYGFMPLHPLILAAVFKIFGEGLLQTRLEAIGASTLSLLLTLLLAKRLFGAWTAALALGLLLLVRWTGTTYVQVTGIPFVDLARIARYDVVVPVFGLGSLLMYLSARDRGGWRYAAAGALAGLAGLAHVYGLFWVAALVGLVVWEGGSGDRRRAVAHVLGGAIAPWLPYLAYVASDLPDWHAQVTGYANRFEVFDPRFYLNNLLEEPRRYGPGLGPPGVGWLLRPGVWTMLLLVPASLVGLIWRAVRRQDRAARAVAVPAILLPVLFALLLRLKLVNYTLTFLPLLAIAGAWGILTAVQALRRRPRRRPLLAVTTLLGLGLAFEGVARLATFQTSPATPYATFIGRVHQVIPAGARVVGLHNYWFGFEDTDYRSFVVPLAWLDPGGLPLDQGLDRLAPDAVLLDDRVESFLSYEPVARAGLDTWLAAHGARLVDQVDDPTYGRMQVYTVRPVATGRTLARPPAYTEGYMSRSSAWL
jgi:4-amino-4-deoxy-L-arabinose transferase-like glycosyltransferase